MVMFRVVAAVAASTYFTLLTPPVRLLVPVPLQRTCLPYYSVPSPLLYDHLCCFSIHIQCIIVSSSISRDWVWPWGRDGSGNKEPHQISRGRDWISQFRRRNATLSRFLWFAQWAMGSWYCSGRIAGYRALQFGHSRRLSTQLFPLGSRRGERWLRLCKTRGGLETSLRHWGSRQYWNISSFGTFFDRFSLGRDWTRSLGVGRVRGFTPHARRIVFSSWEEPTSSTSQFGSL
jgi:hypothetical protein